MGKDEVDEGRQVSGGERDERKEDKTPRRMGDRCVGAKGMRGVGEVTGRGERQSGGHMSERGESGKRKGKW
jgi:hypothetical protein